MADNIPVEGNLDLKGNQIKNVAIEVVSSLPAANNFVGRQVTYQGRSYIWDGSAWKCDSDYLEIGGRNLVLNSEAQYGLPIYAWSEAYYLSEVLEVGQEYTFSIDFLSDGDLTQLSLRPYDSPTPENRQEVPLFGKNKVTFTVTKPNLILFRIYKPNGTDVTFDIGRIKVEKGNKATDWTPAPEDKADVDHDHDATYLGLTAQAVDSAKLDGYGLNYFKKGVGKGSYYKDVVNISYVGTATEILIKTKIPFISSVQMPLIHLEGYAYGNHSPIELRIAFYIYQSAYVNLGCTSTCPWNPTIKLFTYVDNSTTYVGIALIKSIYFPQCTINYIDVWGGSSGVQNRNYSENWTIEYNTVTTPSIVPTDNLTTVPYKPIANSITGNAATATDSDKLDGYHATDFAQLEDGKIKTTNLPDYLLGQVIYGGSINSSQTCTLSSLYKDKFDTTDNTKLLSNLNASSHVGVYFIASESFMLNGAIDVQTGDWVISDGNTWGKIDNTDAVASVNGQTGVVNLSYEDLGGMPKATDTEVGGIVLGFVPELDADLLDGKHASEFATSSQGAKADTALQSIDKTMVENVLTGFITSHDHNYTTYKIFDDSNGVFDANNIFEDVSYYVLNSTNSLNSASLPNELYGDGSVDNSILSPFWFDSSIIKDNNNINQIKQRIVRSGSSVTDSVDNRQNVIAKCYIRVTRGLGAWTPWQRILTSYDEYNGQSDWNQTDPSQRNYIQNKPDIITINNGVNNNESLDDITTTGVYPLIYGRLYEKTPNPACGTLSERNDLEGFLFVYKKDDIVSQQLSQQLHDTINNIFYIRSFDSYNNNWNYWEKIITCKASYGEQGNSPEVTSEGFNLEEQEMPVNTFYNIDTYTPGFTKNLTINIYLDNVDNYLRNNGPAIGEFKITLMFSSTIDNPTLNFYVSSPSFVSTTYLTNGTNPSGLSDISGLEIMIKWYENEIIGGFLFSVYKVNIL